MSRTTESNAPTESIAIRRLKDTARVIVARHIPAEVGNFLDEILVRTAAAETWIPQSESSPRPRDDMLAPPLSEGDRRFHGRANRT